MTAARPEYRALVRHYPEILRGFEVVLSPEDLADLEILVAAIEHTDRVLDASPEAGARRGIAGAVVALLHTGHQRHGVLEPTHAEAVHALRGVAVRRGVGLELARRTAETLANAEAMRLARERAAYLASIEREAALCMELALLIVPLPPAPASFLRAVAGPANYLDKLVDLRGDHARGEVVVDPGARTHAALAGRLVRGALAAWSLHPRKLAAVRWGLGWVGRMAR